MISANQEAIWGMSAIMSAVGSTNKVVPDEGMGTCSLPGFAADGNRVIDQKKEDRA
jgi:hypothetical protein